MNVSLVSEVSDSSGGFTSVGVQRLEDSLAGDTMPPFHDHGQSPNNSACHQADDNTQSQKCDLGEEHLNPIMGCLEQRKISRIHLLEAAGTTSMTKRGHNDADAEGHRQIRTRRYG